MDNVLKIENLDVGYGNGPVVRDLSMTLPRGAIGCLLGPSGCGKTTVLRTIAGFESAERGHITLHGQSVDRNGSFVPPEKRRTGMVFQDYALFPHLTVGENVAFGLKKIPARIKKERVRDLLHTVGLGDLGDSYPHELSGGQQQRVALARALAPEPEILLLDEPFSNLDVTLRESLVHEVRNIIKSTGATALLVTHNQSEAFAMADEIGVMSSGKLLQWGTAQEIYHRPACRQVAEFIGKGTFIKCQATGGSEVRTALGVIKGSPVHPLKPGDRGIVLIRPEDIVHDDHSPFRTDISDRIYRGPNILYTLKLDSGEEVLSLVPSHHDHPEGEKLGIRVELEELVVFGEGSTQESGVRSQEDLLKNPAA